MRNPKLNRRQQTTCKKIILKKRKAGWICYLKNGSLREQVLGKFSMSSMKNTAKKAPQSKILILLI